jgi:predicted SAM-dependent methyltransferase
MSLLQTSVIAVNLGCGTSIAPGWINFDNSPNLRLSKIPLARWILHKVGVLSKSHYEVNWPKEIKYRELTKPLPFKDSSVDFVYTSHFMEHLSFSDAGALFKEIYRVLKIGGVARIILPDLRYDIDRYLENVEKNPSKAADILMEGLNVISKSRDPHLWLYDNHSMVDKLLKAGFSKVEESEYKKGLCKDADILDNRPIVSLFVEAIK